MKTAALYSMLASLLFACTVDYTLDSKQVKKNLVVDGFITTLANSSRIILSYSSNDYRTGSVDFINNAAATVSDDVGNVITFSPIGEKGRYKPPHGYAATGGRKYHLKVTLSDGASYEADDDLISVTPITKLEVVTNPSRSKIDQDEGFDNTIYLYQIYFYCEKASGRNYYKRIQYRNEKEYDVMIWNDDALENKTNKLPTRRRYKKNDVARIDLLSLSERAYKFYADLENIRSNGGGMFTAPAANPVSNISNSALGFFQASDISRMEVIIKP